MCRCCWVMLFCCGWVLAAAEPPDYEALLKQSADGEKASVLVDWAYAERNRNPGLSLQKAEEALAWMGKTSTDHRKALALGLVGLAQAREGKYLEAEKALFEGLVLSRSQKNPQLEVEILNWLGVLYFFKGDLDRAREYYGQVVEQAEATANEVMKANALSNLGIIARRRGMTLEAISNFFEALEIYERRNEIARQANTLNNIGGLYYRMTRYDKALEFYHRSLAIHTGQGNEPGMASSLHNIGITLSYLNRFPEAREHLLKALEIRRRQEDPVKEVSVLLGLTYLEISAKEYSAAREFLDQGRRIVLGHPDSQWGGFYQTEADFYLATGRYGDALASVVKARDSYRKGMDFYGDNELNLILSQIYSEMGDSRRAFHFYKTYKEQYDDKLGSQMAGELSDMENEKRRKRMDQRIRELTAHRRRILWGGLGLVLALLAGLVAAILAQRSLKRRSALILARKEDEISQVKSRMQWMMDELKEFWKQKNRRKYEHSHLGKTGAAALKKKLLEWMVREEPFLNPDLTLSHLAEELGCQSKDLSQVINEQFGKNFNDFINGYRVEMAKKLLRESVDLAILELAYDVGFNSKSSFNASFKKLAGCSPSEYRSRHFGADAGEQNLGAG